MAANGQMVNKTVTFTYDGVSVRLGRGATVDVPAASSLQTAIGAGNLTALTAAQTGAGNAGVDYPGQLSAQVNLGSSYNSGQN